MAQNSVQHVQGAAIKSINLLLITQQRFKLFAGLLNVDINIYFPSYISLRIIMRKIL